MPHIKPAFLSLFILIFLSAYGEPSEVRLFFSSEQFAKKSDLKKFKKEANDIVDKFIHITNKTYGSYGITLTHSKSHFEPIENLPRDYEDLIPGLSPARDQFRMMRTMYVAAKENFLDSHIYIFLKQRDKEFSLPGGTAFQFQHFIFLLEYPPTASATTAAFVGVHEFLHTVGLVHSEHRDDIMNGNLSVLDGPYSTSLKKNQLDTVVADLIRFNNTVSEDAYLEYNKFILENVPLRIRYDRYCDRIPSELGEQAVEKLFQIDPALAKGLISGYIDNFFIVPLVEGDSSEALRCLSYMDSMLPNNTLREHAIYKLKNDLRYMQLVLERQSREYSIGALNEFMITNEAALKALQKSSSE